ncbi:GNAT family N-acetyltransferase [Limibaculum sp. FT325]|uniref:GNAT family N-acetyltransferase n=1 Tax=Thermohalobaculum sediminis TaxID=2939436 RepID=UPI0020C094C2|nr:GNAT family N-acetyltransferase [Limibaculum sediminis]MCL5777804.1 GNAT family N-acetyltransferase [Limibaculum sediminis]
MHDTDEFFGNPDQRALLARARAMRSLTSGDARFSFYGRQVSLTTHAADAPKIVAALARLQGAASCIYVPGEAAEGFRAAIAARGMKTDEFRVLHGAADAVAASRAVMASQALPDDLAVTEIGPDTPGDFLEAVSRLTDACGVLLPMGSVMRGTEKPSVCLVACEPGGAPVATAASVALNHPDGAFPDDAWWGMLATRADRRGQGIARILGAMALVAMHERHGFPGFMTGVREGNTASERLCAQLGVVPSDYRVIVAIDPESFSGGRVTK